MDRIKINVSGEVFETDKELMREKQFNKLIELHDDAVKDRSTADIIVNRPPGTFGAILTYFLTGNLHLPQTVCPRVFTEELQFWKVDSCALQDCCQYKLHAFTDEENTRQKFLSQTARQFASVVYVPKPDANVIIRIRARVWNLIDNNERSIPAKIYFGLVFIMVMLSIISIGLSTVTEFRRDVSKCELLDYLEEANADEYKRVAEFFNHPVCIDGWFITTEDYADYQQENDQNQNNAPNPDANNGPNPEANNGPNPDTNDGPNNDQDNKNKDQNNTQPTQRNATDNSSTWIPQFEQHQDSTTYDEKLEYIYSRFPSIPRLSVPIEAFVLIDILVIAFFTLDFVLRLISCPTFKQYFLSPANMSDTLALLSCYLYILIVTAKRELRYTDSKWLHLLEFFQIFRVFRLFRIVKDVRASKVLAYSLAENLRDMSLLAMLLIIAISSFANLFYFAEDRSVVTSVPMAWYWAIITMTTVGYGDISPKSTFGIVLSILCSISGVLLLAVTLPMFVNNFLCLYQYSCINDSIMKNKERQGKPSSIQPFEQSTVVAMDLEDVKVKPAEMFVQSTNNQRFALP